MATAAEYRIEHVSETPRGYHVRTFAPGPKSDHLVREAFPKGRRRKGSGQLVEILHPIGENPSRCKNPSSVYSFAVSLGYPYLRGDGRVAKDGRTWLSRVTKKADGSGPAIFVGYDQMARKWVIEKEHANPASITWGRNGNPRLTREQKDYWLAQKDYWENVEGAISRKAKKYAWEDVYKKWPELRNPFDWREQREHGGSGSLYDSIRHGDKVTFVDRFGQSRTGRAVMRGPAGWVLNMGGAHGTPQVVHEDMVTRVRKSNPDKGPKKGESVPDYHARRVREILAKMPKPIRDVFDRNPAIYKFIFRNRASNPDDEQLAEAESLYEEFHGREPREILEIQRSANVRGEYTALGDLVELTIIAPNGDTVLMKFKGDGVRLASSPEGEQLYLLGGNQDISANLNLFGADENKDVLDLGDAKQVVYEASKWQTNFDPIEWKHDFGEESGVRPRAFYQKALTPQDEPQIFFAGGNYKVKRPGIVD
jgi:hypothetical protein